MDRATYYQEEVPYQTDFLSGQRWSYEGFGLFAMDLLGVSTLASGLVTIPTVVPSLAVQVGPGRIYSLQNIEGIGPWGQIGGLNGLPADTNPDHNLVKQGIVRDTQTIAITAPTTVGQSQCFLIEVSFLESDAATASRSFYNATVPASATTAAVSPSRGDAAVVTLKAGVAATTGTQTVPAPDSGNIGIAVITCAYGQTSITSANIAAYSGAPLVLTQPQILALIAAAFGPANLPTIPQVSGLPAALAALTPGLAQGQIIGLTLSNTIAAPLTQITTAVGTARDSTNTTDLVMSSPMTKSISSIWASGTGNGCRDNGTAYAANGYAWVFLIWNASSPTAPDILTSLSAAAPTLPTGYTKFRRIGGITFDASGNVHSFTQVGRRFNYNDFCVVDLATATSQGTSAIMRTSLSIPIGVKLRPICIFQTTGTVDGNVYLEAYTDPDEGIPTLGGSTQFAQIRRGSFYQYPGTFGNFGYYCGELVSTSAAGQFYTISTDSLSTIAFKTKGWIDDQSGFN